MYCRNAAIRKFAKNDLVTFGDVDVSEESIRGIHTPGWGGWWVRGSGYNTMHTAHRKVAFVCIG